MSLPDDLSLRAMRALTDEQQEAVTRRSEPLLLSAGAGSGKTSVLVERFVEAVLQDGLAPGKILAITFTDRAAGELRERVRARLLEMGEREAARDTEAAFVGTFHGFCARLLRTHPLLAELDPDFTILDEGIAGHLREQGFSLALRAFLGGEHAEEGVDLVAAYGVDRVSVAITSIHAQLRSSGQRLPRLPEPTVLAGSDEDEQARVACRLLDELLAGFSRSYEELKRERGAVDFDDLELCARDLLDERASVRDSWAERFELLMVDEFQDTNPRQLAILRSLDRGNLFTVGDELQSIYGFRHAEVGLFRARRAELEQRGSSLALTRNFRSRSPLLAVVNSVFGERLAEFTPLQAGRAEKSATEGEPLVELLLTDRCGWDQEEGLSKRIAAGLPGAPSWRQAEARMLAQHVAELVDSGRARAGEVVVLLRALGDLDVYERALQMQGLRTLAAVGAFWEHQQVGDLLAYLRALANPLDELALYSTLASPLVGISRDGLALLALAARASRRGAWETALRLEEDPLLTEMGEDDRAALAGFCVRLRAERERASRQTISELIERAVDHSHYAEHVLALEWGERRLANIHKLLRLARRFEASEGRDLRAFLDHVARLIGAGRGGESDAPVDGVEPDAVRLMSIHAAKGLEFPVVCVADLGRAQNNRLPDLLVDGPRIGLQLVRLDGGKACRTLDYEDLAEERRRAESEEEDRILYVALTRARERILLSAAVDFQRWPEARPGSTAIAWLGPALSEQLPTLAQELAGSWQDLAVGPLHGASMVRVHLNAPTTLGSVLREDSLRKSAPVAGHAQVRRAVSALPAGSGRAHSAQQAPKRTPSISTLSYTALTELERCGYRYYLERILALPEERSVVPAPGTSPGRQGRARGILVHSLLESLDFARPRLPSSEEVGTLARELGVGLGLGESAEIVVLLRAALSSGLAERLATAREVSREHPFAFSLGADEPLVTGVVDLLAREADGGSVVLDYKSDRLALETDLEEVVEREYGVQRLIYALAVLREGAPSVEVIHWFLERPAVWVSTRYAAAEREELELELLQRVSRARERGFAVARDPHRGLCLTCPGRASLCSWSEEVTMREEPLIAEGLPHTH
jgi:ATP-dependent helicase/nuclease subunit A